MKTVFFYGLFMDEDLLREKGLHPQNVRRASLPGFGLRIGQRATLERAVAECSQGMVMQLAGNELDALYGGDGVEDYIPHAVSVTDLTGDAVEAITYLLPMERVSGSNRQYAAALAGVARKLGLPTGYIEEIETWIEASGPATTGR